MAWAIGSTRLLHALMPDEREVRGLLALLLLGHARAATRTDADGALVLLEDQDRAHWDRALIDEGRRLVVEALRGPGAGRYALQAAIAAVHAGRRPTPPPTGARSATCTTSSCGSGPLVALNRAVPVAMLDGPGAGLAAVDALAGDPAWPPTRTSRPPARTCCAAWTVPRRRRRPTAWRRCALATGKSTVGARARRLFLSRAEWCCLQPAEVTAAYVIGLTGAIGSSSPVDRWRASARRSPPG